MGFACVDNFQTFGGSTDRNGYGQHAPVLYDQMANAPSVEFAVSQYSHFVILW